MGFEWVFNGTFEWDFNGTFEWDFDGTFERDLNGILTLSPLKAGAKEAAYDKTIEELRKQLRDVSACMSASMEG